MAPVEDLRAQPLVKKGRRHDRLNDARLRKRDGGGDGGKNKDGNKSSDNQRAQNSPNSTPNSSPNNSPNNSPNSSPNDDDDPPQQTFEPTVATIQLTATILTPTSQAKVTIPATHSSSQSFQPQLIQPSSAAPSFTPTKSSRPCTSTETPLFPSSVLPSSSQGRKGLEPFSTPISAPPSTSVSTTTQWQATTTESTTSVVTEFPTAQLETQGSTATAPPFPTDGNPHHFQNHDDLSPTAQHLLISAGTIGAVIIIASFLYFLMKIRKIDLLAVFRKRPGNKFGFLKSKDISPDDDNFIYPEDTPPPYVPEEKLGEQRQALDGYFAPAVGTAPEPSPAAVAALPEKDPQRLEAPASSLLAAAAPMGTSTAAAASSTNHQEPAFPPTLQRQDSRATQNTTQAFYGSGTFESGQRDQKYLSSVSSLSSGFGDQIIIPEGPGGDLKIIQKPRDTYRQSRMSWMQGNPLGSRDTVYTNASIESAPRFRTINSWVVQQSDRVERQQEMANEVPNMPEIPSALVPGHNRNESEDQAFRAHPGDEIPIASGTRVPSGILDKKTGV
ncbi:hypothetical protein BP5796_00476 [Coleophoma crateriformis]|uniref:Uncharacterized protein n=1 Tax=Coleophoma crateriformis TaxID=565419 RepID=A0A3D8T813_9HELO|nr:hypothetical protein BP5796_00476 [Coleophoma crateriformis]